MSRLASPWPLLDALRTVAALLVVFGHTRNWFFLPISSVASPGVLLKLFWFVTVLEHEAVVIFFVLSGFLVGGNMMHKMRGGCFKLKDYLIARFARIYIVYFPALLLTFVTSWLGQTFLSDPGQESIRPLFSGTETMTSYRILCHVAGVQGLFCEAWSENPALWSLGYEWTLYLLAPIILGLVMRAHRFRGIAMVALFAVSIEATGANHDWPIWFAAWFLGTTAASFNRSGGMPLSAPLGGIVLTVAGMAVARLQVIRLELTDCAIGLGVAMAIASGPVVRFAIAPRFFQWAAGFSYSVYAVHLPIIFVTIAILQGLGLPAYKLPANSTAFGAFGITVAVALLAGYVFSLLTERHTERARRWLQRLLSNEQRGSPDRSMPQRSVPQTGPASTS